jgi:hypothetical protein
LSNTLTGPVIAKAKASGFFQAARARFQADPELIFARAVDREQESGSMDTVKSSGRAEELSAEAQARIFGHIGVANLRRRFPDWRYMAWIDGDITFFNPTVVTDTLYRLQRHPVGQMWSRACDLTAVR